MNSIHSALTQLSEQLTAHSSTPCLDAELLLQHVLDKPRDYLYRHPEIMLSIDQEKNLAVLIARRMTGEPIAYILGHQAFWTFDLMVTPDTLIPRPETELLVEIALKKLDRIAPLKIADLGTGSGAVALALASECPTWQLNATDQSIKAIKIAKQNAKQLKINNIEFHHGDWCQALPKQRFHAIVSNPPYIPSQDPHLSALRFEPRAALVAGPDGLHAITLIITQAQDYLHPQGYLILEHGYDQAQRVAQLLQAAGYQNIENHRDLAGNPRVSIASKNDQE